MEPDDFYDLIFREPGVTRRIANRVSAELELPYDVVKFAVRFLTLIAACQQLFPPDSEVKALQRAVVVEAARLLCDDFSAAAKLDQIATVRLLRTVGEVLKSELRAARVGEEEPPRG